jgi:hypothetical protein
VPYANVAFMQQHLPKKNVKLFNDAELNHFVPWNRPDLIKDAIYWITQRAYHKAQQVK